MEKRKITALELIELRELLERAYRAKMQEMRKELLDQELHDLIYGDMKVNVESDELDQDQILHVYAVIFGRCRYIVTGGVNDDSAEQAMRFAAQVLLALARDEEVPNIKILNTALLLAEKASALELAKMRY